jgi:tripartite-type tricarboxylate transporter receptor subunit TctC
MREIKRNTIRDVSMLVAALVLAGTIPTPVTAQTYPSKQIELVVPFVAGGTTDIVARMIAQHFADTWSATAIVNNRPGGGSMIGTGAVAKSPPDGHTLLVTTIAFAINAGMQKLPFDPATDLVPVSESLDPADAGRASIGAGDFKELVVSSGQSGKWDYATRAPARHHTLRPRCSVGSRDRYGACSVQGNAEAMNAFLGGHIKIYRASAGRASARGK